jgi:Tfp pilus assembly protein FimV
MKTRRIPLAIAVAAALLTPNSVALAAALGEVATLSALGERFRAEIQLVGSGGIQASCFRVVPPGDTSAGIPGLTSGRVSIVGQGANVRLVVRDDRAVSDPVLQLAIENVCEARLRREYTLLMPFTAAKPVSAPVSAAPARKPAATRSPPATPRGGTASAPKARPQKTAVRTWSTAPGESLESLGEALYPDDPSA